MKKLIFIVVVLTLTVGALIAARSTSARTMVTEFEARETICEITPGKEWKSGNRLHIRGQTHSNIWVSENDEIPLAGPASAVINLMLNLESGDGAVWGTFRLDPTDVNGTWEGRFNGKLTGPDSLASGRAVAFGTGDLAGQKLFEDFQEFELGPEDPEPPCEGAFGPIYTLHTGRILHPHGD